MSTGELLQSLRVAKGVTLRPAASDHLHRLARCCGDILPAGLSELYRICDGADGAGGACLRPLPVSEVICAAEWFPPLLHRWRGILCFTDDQSNYAGIYAQGPLVDMVFLLHHEEPCSSPRYWSVDDLLRADLGGSVEDALWGRARAQLPAAMVAQTPQEEAKSSRLADEVSALAEVESNEDVRHELQMCAMHLLPRRRAAELIAMLGVDDIWIPELAAELLGVIGDEAALPELMSLAQRGKRNGDIAAIRAIGRIGTSAAQRLLLQLAVQPGFEPYGPYLTSAMKDAGLSAELSQGVWRYRETASSPWRRFGAG